MNIIEQIREALDILKSYPNIEEVVDLETADRFLGRLESISIKKFAPSSPPPNITELVDRIREEMNGRYEEWRKAIEVLPHVLLWDERICLYDESVESAPLLIGGSFPANRLEMERDDLELNGYFDFWADLTATLTIGNKEETGSWQEIYQKLGEFVTKGLAYPEVPTK